MNAAPESTCDQAHPGPDESPLPPTLRDLTALMDVTGSMRIQWDHVRAVVVEAIGRAARVAPGLAIEWVAYGDYDSGTCPLVRSGPQRDPKALERFIAEIVCGGGDDGSGDGRAEAVEAALRYGADARARRCILIGDAPAHRERDWVIQASRLADALCPVHTFLVETYHDADLERARQQFSEIARITGGTFQVLGDGPEQLAHVIAAAAIAARDPGLLVRYESEYRPGGEAQRFVRALRLLGPAKGTSSHKPS